MRRAHSSGYGLSIPVGKGTSDRISNIPNTPNPDYVPPVAVTELEADAEAEYAFQQAIDAARILGFLEDEPIAILDRHGRDLLPIAPAPHPAPGTGDPHVSAMVASLKESVARDRKARKIAAIWVGCDAATVDVMAATDAQWAMATEAAGYSTKPSDDGLVPSVKTRQRVIELLTLGDRLARAATGMAVRVVKGGQ